MDNIEQILNNIKDENSISKPLVTDRIVRLIYIDPFGKYESVDVTEYVTNIEQFEIKESRDDFSSTMVKLSNKLSFFDYGYELFVALLDKYGLYARAQINVMLRADKSNEYKLQDEIILEFQDFKQDLKECVFDISGRDNSIQALIKSGKSTKYDILVSDIADSKKWKYDRMQLDCLSKFGLADSNDGEYDTKFQYTYLFLSITSISNEVVYGSDPHIGVDQYLNQFYGSADLQSELDSNFFFKAFGDVSIKINVSFKLYTQQTGFVPNNEYKDLKLYLIKNNKTILKEYLIPSNGGSPTITPIDFLLYEDLKEGESLSLILYLDQPNATLNEPWLYAYMFGFRDFKTFRIDWTAKGQPFEMDVIAPDRLLQALLDKITGNTKNKAVIEWEDETLKLMLCAAETIRGQKDPKIHTSMGELLDLFSCLGYEHTIGRDNIRLMRRKNVFLQDVGLSLDETEVSELMIMPLPQYGFSTVKAGWKKKDYGDSANGKYEFNGTFDYSTGFSSEKAIVLEIIAPYRADSIGLEILSWSRGDITSTNSDNDVFVIAMDVSDDEFYRESYMYAKISGQVRMFNGYLSPDRIVRRNVSKVGIITDYLTFTATDSGRDTQDWVCYENRPCQGIPTTMFYNIVISEKLFDPIKYTFSTGSYKTLPNNSDYNKLISFIYNNSTFYGYISDISKKYGKEVSIEWELIAKKIQ